MGTILLALLLVAGCGGGNDDDASEGRGRTDSTPPAAETSTTTGTTAPGVDAVVVAAVEAAYREATAAEFAFDSEVGLFDPNAFKEKVGRFLTGEQYETSFEVSQQRRLRGEVFSPPGLQPGEIAPKVSIEGPGRATVRDCAADHATVKAATGERVDEPTEGRELVVVEMVLEAGQWKIAKSTALGEPCTV